MDTPGIEVRQIPSIIGEGDIHEVFFTDVIVPADARLGQEGEAWEIIAYSLTNERLGIPRYVLARGALDRAVKILTERGEFSRESIRQQAAQVASLCEAARVSTYALIDQRVRGNRIGAEASVARFAVVTCERAVAEFVVEHLPEALSGFQPFLMMHHQRGIVAGIASGAAEIQLNLIATEVLELPREPR
jgi:alkylation response protein AidB-like acyl-CoA dehydrogenase